MSVDKKLSPKRSALGKARGLGAAKEGTGHWWAMRITSVVLIPLGLWLVISLMGVAGLEQSQVQVWLKDPVRGAVLALFLLFGLHHSAHGLQVVIEDYLHAAWKKYTALALVTVSHIAAAGFGLFAILASVLRV